MYSTLCELVLEMPANLTNSRPNLEYTGSSNQSRALVSIHCCALVVVKVALTYMQAACTHQIYRHQAPEYCNIACQQVLVLKTVLVCLCVDGIYQREPAGTVLEQRDISCMSSPASC